MEPLYIGIIAAALLIIAISLSVYFATRSSDSSSSDSTIVTTTETETESEQIIELTVDYLTGLSTFSDTIASITTDEFRALENYVETATAPDNLLEICQHMGICEDNKENLAVAELIAFHDWLENDDYFYCQDNFRRSCVINNGATNHEISSTWVDNTSQANQADCENAGGSWSSGECTYTVQGHVSITETTAGEITIVSNNIPAHDIGFNSCKAKYNNCYQHTDDTSCQDDPECLWTGSTCEDILHCNFAAANGYAENVQTFTVPNAPSYECCGPRNCTDNSKCETDSGIYYNSELSQTRDDGIMLDGVVIDIFSGGCYDLDDNFPTGNPDNNGNKKVGCMNDDNNGVSADYYYLLDPVFEENMFAVDDNNAHTQDGGAYHYHANPTPNIPAVDAGTEPQVIGFAADGHPIYELWDGATSCYKIIQAYQDEYDSGTDASGRTGATRAQLWTGANAPVLPPIDDAHPPGMYIQDYEWDSTDFGNGTCNLDEANGMIRNDQYGYYVTTEYPYIIRKFKDDPHWTFCKSNTETAGECGSSGGGGGGRQRAPPTGGGQAGGGGQQGAPTIGTGTGTGAPTIGTGTGTGASGSAPRSTTGQVGTFSSTGSPSM